MWKLLLFVILITGGILSPVLVYAGGNCDLTIENKTGAHISQIIISETESAKKLKQHNRIIENDMSTAIRIKNNTLYDIILVDTNERQYAKKRLAWEGKTAIITFNRKDIVDRDVWDKVKKVILWPLYM